MADLSRMGDLKCGDLLVFAACVVHNNYYLFTQV